MKTSIDHLPASKQQELDYIVKVIRDEFEQVTGFSEGKKKHSRILKIILFGSHATGKWVNDPVNGYLSDYDILVILNTDELKDEHKIWMRAENRIQLYIKPPITLIVHSLHEVNSALAEGQYFFTDIKQQGVELYSDDGRELATAKNLSPEEAKVIAERHFKQWIQSGSEFIDFAKFGRDTGRLNKAAFLLHQAAEALYSCVMLVYTNYKPNTHNLVQLNNMVISQEMRFTEVFPQNTRFARSRFQLLKRAYVEARYSEHYEINTEQLDWLIERVELLQKLTKERCEARIVYVP
ncbi:MAG: HEPN domain-containing protein [Marinobacterium sp.]|nr:HEPN domain-containing protein [Marinobacterium sp.]